MTTLVIGKAATAIATGSITFPRCQRTSSGAQRNSPRAKRGAVCSATALTRSAYPGRLARRHHAPAGRLDQWSARRDGLRELLLRHLRAPRDVLRLREPLQLLLREPREVAVGRPLPAVSAAAVPRRPPATLDALEALAERLHEVGRFLLLGLGDGVHLFALLLPLDDLEQRVMVGVLVRLGLPFAGEALDEAQRHVELALRDARQLAGENLLGPVDLVGEVHLLERQAPVANAEAPEVLTAAHHELADAREPRLLHRTNEERVGTLGSVLRPDEVRVREERRVDLLVRDEVLELDRVLALDADRVEVLFLHVDDLALLVLERLDDLVVRDRLVLELADLLIPDRAVVRRVHEMKPELVLVHGAEDPHRDVHEPEADRAGPDRAWRHTCGSPGAPLRKPADLAQAPVQPVDQVRHRLQPLCDHAQAILAEVLRLDAERLRQRPHDLVRGHRPVAVHQVVEVTRRQPRARCELAVGDAGLAHQGLDRRPGGLLAEAAPACHHGPFLPRSVTANRLSSPEARSRTSTLPSSRLFRPAVMRVGQPRRSASANFSPARRSRSSRMTSRPPAESASAASRAISSAPGSATT